MRSFALAGTALLLLVACNSPVAVTDAASNARFERSVNAPVNIVSLGGTLTCCTEKYGMTAHKDANGGVSGHIEVRNLDGVTSFSGDVTCLQVQDNMAWVGVDITKSDATTGRFIEGGSFWFRVQDNGEGSGAPADVISSLNPNGGSARCNERRTGLPLAWPLQGNAQVK